MRLLALLCAVACSSASKPPAASQPSTPDPGARKPLLAKDNAKFEGPTFKNACGKDSDCFVGGCSGELCTAEEGVNSVCVVYPDQPRGASCGCLSGECMWYAGAADPTGAEPAGAGLPGQGEPCKDGKCSEGLKCVTYYGIAGPRGPAFTSCEIPCGMKGTACPQGQKCTTIADGPGQVCRPM